MLQSSGLRCAMLLFACTLAFAVDPPTSAPPTRTILHAADLQADVAILRKAYENLHPGLYRYNTKSQMDAEFDSLTAQLSHDQSLQDAYLAFSRFAAKVKCGHTYTNFFNQPDPVVEELFRGTKRVPFYFEWINGKIVVTVDFTPSHQLPSGTVIQQIDGVPSQTILAQLLTISRADGSNDAKRIAYLGVRGDSLYEAFDVFYPMFFPGPPGKMKILLQPPGGATPHTVEVEPLTFEQRVAPIKSREASRKGGAESQFQWKYMPDGSAYLNMPTWALYDSKWDWKAWLNTHLDELVEKKSPALIVDLRGNEGGNDVGNLILARLITQDLRLSSYLRFVRYRRVPDDLAPFLDTWDPSFKDWGAAAVELPSPWPTAPPLPYYRLKKFDDDSDGDVLHPQGKRYTGKVFVLIDSNNSSATFQFAQIIQRNRLGLLVGQPTGGNLRGINGGAFFFLRLPKSKIEIDLPLIATFPENEQPDAGLRPDIPVVPTIADIANGSDPVLAAVAAAIRKSLR